jgi:glucose-specific phosphotransferase system IIA component
MSLVVASPFAGTVVDLGEVSDPVFADRLVGDGVALRPDAPGTLTVVAPAAGRITKLFPGGHGIAIETDAGAILVHVGIDTVRLEGRGFRTIARQEDTVATGDPLVEVDLGVVAAAGYEAITPVLAIAGQEVAPIAAPGTAVGAGDPLFRIL